jgi:hypothetical protein
MAENWLERVMAELGDMAVKKTVQGAAELSQALNSQSNAYVPYGAGQQALEIEGPQMNYQEMLRDSSSQVIEEPERGMER